MSESRPLLQFNVHGIGSGVLAGMLATALLHPVDVVKLRMQLASRSYKHVEMIRVVYKYGGYKAFLRGFNASQLRQILFTTTRLGVHAYLHDRYLMKHGEAPKQSTIMKHGLLAGSVAALMGTPAEVVMVRIVGSRPAEYAMPHARPEIDARQAAYTSLWNGLTRIVREEGVLALWHGGRLVVMRSMIFSSLQLPSYLTAIDFLRHKIELRDGFTLHFLANVFSCLVACPASLPVDVIKNRYQNYKVYEGVTVQAVVAYLRTRSLILPWHLSIHATMYSAYLLHTRTFTERLGAGAYGGLSSTILLFTIYFVIFLQTEESTKQDETEGTSCASSSKENSERAPLVAQKIDSLAKLLFNKSFIGTGSGKSSPSEPPASPKMDRSIEGSAALAICNDYLSQTSRYDMLSQLCGIGSRPSKHWFAIHDNSIKTDRLLTLMPLTSKCPIEQSERSRGLVLELFRALHHPYIYPVLDLELCNGHALTVLPFNARGSLKDLIYKSTWNEEYSRKYGSTGTGLPAWQVARFGRQMLEGLLFLKDKGFPPFRHLHSGNVVVQNGVARICGLDNTLIGALPRCPIALAAPLESVEALCLGHVLYEMCAGSELDLTLLSDLMPNYPNVVEIIETIFGPRTPTLHELLLCELFRKIDLREMKGSCLPNFSQRLSRSCLSLLGEVSRRQPGSPRGTPPHRSPATPPARRRHFPVDQDYTEEWQW